MLSNIMYISMKHKHTWPQLIWLEFLNIFKQFCLNHTIWLVYRDVTALDLKENDQLES